MGLLDVNLDEREELKLLPDNEEAKLRISRADITENRRDPNRSNLALVFDVADDPLVDDIRVWLPIPNDQQKQEDPKGASKALRRIEEFAKAFGVSLPCETEDMLGREGWAVLREDEDLNGNPVNGIRRFVPPKG